MVETLGVMRLNVSRMLTREPHRFDPDPSPVTDRRVKRKKLQMLPGRVQDAALTELT